MIWCWIGLIIFLFFGLVVFRGSPYVPSQKKYIKQAFTELYKISKKDILVDIGSGDGIVLRQAARLGATTIGYEINPLLVLISRLISINDKRITTYLADFWSVKIPNDTTVVYIFSVVRDVKGLTDRLQKETNRIGHSIYLISYAADFNDFKLIKKVAAYKLYLINKI